LHPLVRKQKQGYQRKAASHKQVGKEKGTNAERKKGVKDWQLTFFFPFFLDSIKRKVFVEHKH
jgi:hypothetical protein